MPTLDQNPDWLRYQQFLKSGQLRGATGQDPATGRGVGSYVDPSIKQELYGINERLGNLASGQGGLSIDPTSYLWTTNPAALPQRVNLPAQGTPNFQQEVQRRLQSAGIQPAPQPVPPRAGTPQDPNAPAYMTPEARTAMMRGAEQTKGTAPSAYSQALQKQGFGAPPPPQPSTAGEYGVPYTGAPISGPALDLAGKPFNQQAQILSSWMAQYGYPVEKFAVGGVSPVDNQLLTLMGAANMAQSD